MTIFNYFAQMCLGVSMLHENQIAHRDLKPANVFQNTNRGFAALLQIGDFGVSKKFGAMNDGLLEMQMMTTVAGTPFYQAPELMDEDPYNEKVDIWSLGIILYQLCTLDLPWPRKTYKRGVRSGEVPNIPFSANDDLQKELNEIIHLFLQRDP